MPAGVRKPGSWTFYAIQHQAWNYPHQDESWQWVNSCFDHFGFPHDDFKPSGRCWQATGNHGVFDLEAGKIALRAIAEKHRGTCFRLVRRTITLEEYEEDIVLIGRRKEPQESD